MWSQIKYQLYVKVRPIWGQMNIQPVTRVNLVSIWSQFEANVELMLCQYSVNSKVADFMSKWSQIGVCCFAFWYKGKVNSVSSWCQYGVDTKVESNLVQGGVNLMPICWKCQNCVNLVSNSTWFRVE